MRPTVLLFDIDGTLVTTVGAGRRSIDRAFEVLHGRPDVCRHFSSDGMTDRGIVRLGLEGIGVAVDAAPKDVTAAQSIGAESFAVSTRVFETLAADGALEALRGRR